MSRAEILTFILILSFEAFYFFIWGDEADRRIRRKGPICVGDYIYDFFLEVIWVVLMSRIYDSSSWSSESHYYA